MLTATAPATRVFITGCARSGTTLLNRLFYAFSGVSVVDREITLDEYCSCNPDGNVLIAKRTPRTILSVPLPENELRRQADLLSSAGIHVINLVRDGRDVVHQHRTGPRVNVNRWIGCMLQAQQFRSSIALEVRYEDLVAVPDRVQSRISQVTGLRASTPFSRYPEFVNSQVFDEPDFRNLEQYRRRRIDQESIGHSPNEYVGLCNCDNEKALFERILTRLGYIGDKRQDEWDECDVEQEQQLFESLSSEIGYGCD